MWEWLKNRIYASDSASLRSAVSETADPNLKKRVTVLFAKFDPLTIPPRATMHASQLAVGRSRNQSPPPAERQRRRRRIARFTRRFSDMAHFEARLLFAIHRRTIKALAAESPAALQRDLQRFSLSTHGQRILRHRPLPTIAKVRAWVAAARLAADSQTAAAKPQVNVAG